MELEMDTQRIEKIKEYLSDEKYLPYVEEILDAKVLKYYDILKYWLIFTGKSKEEINFSQTNLFDFRRCKKLFDRNTFIDEINSYNPRGSKSEITVKSYAKWERIIKCLEKFDQNAVATYNIALAFILRFLQVTGKVRLADRTKRLDIMTTNRRNRIKIIEENQEKLK